MRRQIGNIIETWALRVRGLPPLLPHETSALTLDEADLDKWAEFCVGKSVLRRVELARRRGMTSVLPAQHEGYGGYRTDIDRLVDIVTQDLDLPRILIRCPLRWLWAIKPEDREAADALFSIKHAARRMPGSCESVR